MMVTRAKREYYKYYYQNNPDYFKERARRREQEIKAFVQQQKVGYRPITHHSHWTRKPPDALGGCLGLPTNATQTEAMYAWISHR
jgi:hypothetical protein